MQQAGGWWGVNSLQVQDRAQMVQQHTDLVPSASSPWPLISYLIRSTIHTATDNTIRVGYPKEQTNTILILVLYSILFVLLTVLTVIGIGTNKTMQYFNGTVNSTLLHYYLVIVLWIFMFRNLLVPVPHNILVLLVASRMVVTILRHYRTTNRTDAVPPFRRICN